MDFLKHTDDNLLTLELKHIGSFQFLKQMLEATSLQAPQLCGEHNDSSPKHKLNLNI